MPDISKRLEKAERYLQKGRPEAALEEYLAALDEDPRNDQVRQTAAELCLRCGRNSEAASLLSTLLDEQVSASDPRGILTYKKLTKVATPTPFQTLQYAQLIAKKTKRKRWKLTLRQCAALNSCARKNRRWLQPSAWSNLPRRLKICSAPEKRQPVWDSSKLLRQILSSWAL